jgi:hypothetical protein
LRTRSRNCKRTTRGWLNLKGLKKPDWLRFRSSSVTIITTIMIAGITTTIIITITTITITKAHEEKGTSKRMSLFPACSVAS